jgi:hypothetical protein
MLSTDSTLETKRRGLLARAAFAITRSDERDGVRSDRSLHQQPLAMQPPVPGLHDAGHAAGALAWVEVSPAMARAPVSSSALSSSNPKNRDMVKPP